MITITNLLYKNTQLSTLLNFILSLINHNKHQRWISIIVIYLYCVKERTFICMRIMGLVHTGTANLNTVFKISHLRNVSKEYFGLKCPESEQHHTFYQNLEEMCVGLTDLYC